MLGRRVRMNGANWSKRQAIEGNLAEVQMGQLAQKNGTSDGVRSFGQMLEKDHADANKATAAANSLPCPAQSSPRQRQARQQALHLTAV